MSRSDIHPSAGEAFLTAAFDPANRADPYPLYARTRAATPVLDAGNQLWVTFTHGAAHRLLRAKGTSSDERNSAFHLANVDTDPKLQQFADRDHSMLFLDPPDHTRLRGLVSSAFTPKTVERLVPRMQAMTNDLLDRMATSGADGAELDLVEALATRPLEQDAIVRELWLRSGVDARPHARLEPA